MDGIQVHKTECNHITRHSIRLAHLNSKEPVTMTVHRIRIFVALLACTLSACVNQTTPTTTISTPDTSAPTISLNASASSLTKAGSLTLTATVSDDVGVSSVEFFKNGSSLGTVIEKPFGKNILITITDNGTLEFTATAKDAAGNSKTSEPLSVTVNIPVPAQADTTPPTITLTSSASSFTSAGNLTLTATATDNVGVTGVEFFKNGSSLGTVLKSPFTKSVPISAADNGTLEFKAKAVDAAGNSKLSDPVNVTVQIHLWPKQLSEGGYIYGVAVNQVGDVFAAGFVSGAFPGFTNTGSGSPDAFIAKYDANANQTWVKQFGTADVDEIKSVAVDGRGDILITGNTTGEFPGFTHSTSFADVFVAKYDTNGNRKWLKQFGTSEDDYATSVAVDSSGNVFIAGYGGQFTGFTSAGGYDAFLTKFDADGNQIWLKQFGTSREDAISDLVADGNGNVVVVGNTEGVFDTAATPGSVSGFMAKFDANGNKTWLKQFGPGNAFGRRGVAMDGSGNIVVVGSVADALDGQSALGDSDAVVAKYDSSGKQLWLKQFGTSGADGAYGVAVDTANRVIVSGVTYAAFAGFTNPSGADGFVTQFDASGNQTWLKQFGTNQYDFIYGIAVNGNGHVFVGGETDGAFDGFTNPGGSYPFINSFASSGAQR
jgi:hypothetical protein